MLRKIISFCSTSTYKVFQSVPLGNSLFGKNFLKIEFLVYFTFFKNLLFVMISFSFVFKSFGDVTLYPRLERQFLTVLSPPENGSKFRYFQINPTPEGVPMEMMQEIAADAFEKIGAAHHRVDTSKHPAMHKTDTIDYIILLKGDVTLVLDEEEVTLEPHDVVVQRGTNHAWVNNGDEPALLIAVLIDSDLK